MRVCMMLLLLKICGFPCSNSAKIAIIDFKWRVKDNNLNIFSYGRCCENCRSFFYIAAHAATVTDVYYRKKKGEQKYIKRTIS